MCPLSRILVNLGFNLKVYSQPSLRNRFIGHHDINVMDIFYSKSYNKIISVILFFVILAIMTTGISSFPSYIDQKSLLPDVFAQVSEPWTNSSNIRSSNSDLATNSSMGENNSRTMVASGHFANNQMKDGKITWIQGGFWNLAIDNSSQINMENTNANATFDANFTMIRPNGSLSHNHAINNFTSTNVIFAGNDVVITGFSHINSNNGTEYEDVPITIHLMGKKVLGLMIDVNKTGGHFAGSNEMYGTSISGIGLENSTSITNNTVNGRMTGQSNNITSTNSMAHTEY